MNESWSCNSNSATSIRLVGGPNQVAKAFHPDFTYPMFGEAETIYGYQGLNIGLHFSSSSLMPLLKVSYQSKNESTTAKIDDVEATLMEFLPKDCIVSDQAKWDEAIEKDQIEFRPLGEKIHTYTRRKGGTKGKGKGKAGAAGGYAGDDGATREKGARVFEIYRSTWDTPGFVEYHRRMQIFSLFFIEGASYIQEDETNWEFFCVYERVKQTDDDDDKEQFTWHFVGYTSLYRFWCWPDASRIRLSQFVILPPFQKQGHGSSLYSTVHDEMLKRNSVTEMTVEDPSEAFDRVRDGSDLRRLLAPGGLVERAKKDGQLEPPMDPKWSETKRLERKIAPRQWSRLMEMIQLLHLNADNVDQIRAYRLQVKARLYRFNKDILTQLPKEERLIKLQETFEGVIDEYGELVGVDIEPFLQADDQSIQNGHADGPPRKMARLA